MNLLKFVFAGVLASTLTACPAIISLLDSASITVRNNCIGADSLVSFYLDGVYQGNVGYSRTFYTIAGVHSLYAQGLGYGGYTFQRSAYVSSGFAWILCP
jgi:hypothetical protein